MEIEKQNKLLLDRRSYEEAEEIRNGEKSVSKPLGNLLGRYLPPAVPATPKKGGINSPFNEAVFDVIQFLEEKPRHGLFAFWCGRLRGISPQDLYMWMSKAKQEGRRPQALFIYQLKEHRKKYPTSAKKVIHTRARQQKQKGVI